MGICDGILMLFLASKVASEGEEEVRIWSVSTRYDDGDDDNIDNAENSDSDANTNTIDGYLTIRRTSDIEQHN